MIISKKDLDMVIGNMPLNGLLWHCYRVLVKGMRGGGKTLLRR